MGPLAGAGEITPAPGLRAELATALVRVADGRFRSYRWEREPEVVAVYFGAGWCAPCHAFVPRLRTVYQELRRLGVDTEVVFVSLDRSERAMLRYMEAQEMPWPAVDRRRLASLPHLRRLAGEASPNLVLVARDGRVLAGSWRDGEYEGTEAVLDRWIQQGRAGDPPPGAAAGTAPESD